MLHLLFSPEFWSGVNAGAIVMFFCYLVLGKFALLIMFLYVGAWGYTKYKSFKEAPKYAEVPLEDDLPELTGEMQPLNHLSDFPDELAN